MVLFRCVVLVADYFVALRILNPKPYLEDYGTYSKYGYDKYLIWGYQ